MHVKVVGPATKIWKTKLSHVISLDDGQIINEMISKYGDKNRHTDVNGIDWCQLALCNAMGRQCDDKSLNILFCENVENDHVVSTSGTFVEARKIKKRKRKSNTYNFKTKIITEMKRCPHGLPDTLFLTQIFNESKYDSIPNDHDDKKTHQIFSERGMFTTSLYAKKMIPDYSDWKFCCRRCETTIDFSTHSPGDYKNTLINSKLLCVIAFDTTLASKFHLSFGRLTGGYSHKYILGLIGSSNDSMTNGQLTSLRNCAVFGTEKRNIQSPTADMWNIQWCIIR